MRTSRTPDEVLREIVGLAMKVHRTLGPGFLESVYQNALVVELRKAGFAVESQHPLKVYYEEAVVGEFAADLLMNGSLLVELKAAAIEPAHEAQVMNYLHATGLDHGLLINFGASSLQFRSKSRTYQKPETPSFGECSI